MQLARRIGKVAALVGVCPGFVGNRILAQRQREAGKLVLEGAMPWDVDRVLVDFAASTVGLPSLAPTYGAHSDRKVWRNPGAAIAVHPSPGLF
jgi:3-hydroxyacyl-CoA dehydrogenase